jgi:hypothetical protein
MISNKICVRDNYLMNLSYLINISMKIEMQLIARKKIMKDF